MKLAVCVNPCALNLFQQTLLEYQRVLGITLNTEEADLILALRDLECLALLLFFEGRCHRVLWNSSFFPKRHTLCPASHPILLSDIYYIPHWYVYWQVILAKIKQPSGRFLKILNGRPGLWCPSWKQCPVVLIHIIPSLRDPHSSLVHSRLPHFVIKKLILGRLGGSVR